MVFSWMLRSTWTFFGASSALAAVGLAERGQPRAKPPSMTTAVRIAVVRILVGRIIVSLLYLTTMRACIWWGCRPQATAQVPGGTAVGLLSLPVQVSPPAAAALQVHLLRGVMRLELVGNGLVPGSMAPTLE